MKRLSLEDVGRQELSGIIGWCLNGSFLWGGGGLGNIFQDVKYSIPFLSSRCTPRYFQIYNSPTSEQNCMSRMFSAGLFRIAK